jgi:hypothetical protein
LEVNGYPFSSKLAHAGISLASERAEISAGKQPQHRSILFEKSGKIWCLDVVLLRAGR